MRRAAGLLVSSVPAAVTAQVHQQAANALTASSAATDALNSVSNAWKRSPYPCGHGMAAYSPKGLPNCCSNLHTSSCMQQSSSKDPTQQHEASSGKYEHRSSCAVSHSINPIDLDHVLQNRALAARRNSSSSANSSSIGGSVGNSSDSTQLSEQLISELFDAELEQRLLAAAAAAAHAPAPAPAAAAGACPTTDSTDDSSPAAAAAAGDATLSGAFVSSAQSQSVKQHFSQPGVTATPALTAPQQQQQPSSSSSGPPRVSSWHPLLTSDPWAPLPSPAVARQRLAGQLSQLLLQTGVPPAAAAAALAQAAADTPGQHAAAAQEAGTRSSRTSSRQNMPQGKTGTKGSSKQANSSSSSSDYLAVLNRLRADQVVALLEDCQAPTYGAKQLLLRRLVLLLQEQQTLQGSAVTAAAGFSVTDDGAGLSRGQRDGQGLGLGFEPWAEGEAGFRGSGYAETTTTATSSSSGSRVQSSVQGKDSSSSSSSTRVNAVQQALQQQQQQQGSSRNQLVLAAAAARQLLDHVLDVQQVGSWLMAARAQDVCIVDVSGRAGLHKQLVIASGFSQRHTHACAEAVAWQLKEKAKVLLQQQQQQQQSQQQQQQQQQIEGTSNSASSGAWSSSPAAAALGAGAEGAEAAEPNTQQQQQQASSNVSTELLPVNVVGGPSADWSVMDAGSVVVHVLTERARRFYNLEGLWGGPQGRFITWLKPEQVVETKDTIGRGT